MISSLEAYQAGRVDQSGFEHPVGTLDDQAGEAGPGRLVRDELPGREKLDGQNKAGPGWLDRVGSFPPPLTEFQAVFLLVEA